MEIGKQGIKVMHINMCDLPEEETKAPAEGEWDQSVIEKTIQESIEFQVPVKRVKSINRPKIIKNDITNNKFAEIQETEVHDPQEGNDNPCVNSLQRNLISIARADVDIADCL